MGRYDLIGKTPTSGLHSPLPIIGFSTDLDQSVVSKLSLNTSEEIEDDNLLRENLSKDSDDSIKNSLLVSPKGKIMDMSFLSTEDIRNTPVSGLKKHSQFNFDSKDLFNEHLSPERKEKWFLIQSNSQEKDDIEELLGETKRSREGSPLLTPGPRRSMNSLDSPGSLNRKEVVRIDEETSSVLKGKKDDQVDEKIEYETKVHRSNPKKRESLGLNKSENKSEHKSEHKSENRSENKFLDGQENKVRETNGENIKECLNNPGNDTELHPIQCLFRTNSHTDVVIPLSNEQKINVHRLILLQHPPFLTESHSNFMKIPHQLCIRIIHYLYGFDTQFKSLSDALRTLEQTLEHAPTLKSFEKNVSYQLYKRFMDTTSILEILKFCQKFPSSSLKDYCSIYIKENFHALAQNKQLQNNLSKDFLWHILTSVMSGMNENVENDFLPAFRLAHHLQHLFESGEGSDLELIAGKKKYYIHKTVLHAYGGKVNPEKKKIDLGKIGLSSKRISTCLEALYQHKSIQENCMDLLHLGKYLKLKRLSDILLPGIMKNFNDENAIQITSQFKKELKTRNEYRKYFENLSKKTLISILWNEF